MKRVKQCLIILAAVSVGSCGPVVYSAEGDTIVEDVYTEHYQDSLDQPNFDCFRRNGELECAEVLADGFSYYNTRTLLVAGQQAVVVVDKNLNIKAIPTLREID